MPKQKGKKVRADSRAAYLGRYAGVPTSFFGIEIEGARYLARVLSTYAKDRSCVWLKFESDGMKVYVPLDMAIKWLITDEEAANGEWYSDSESEEEAKPPQMASPKSVSVGRVAQKKLQTSHPQGEASCRNSSRKSNRPWEKVLKDIFAPKYLDKATIN